jgi:hypothetical protein
MGEGPFKEYCCCQGFRISKGCAFYNAMPFAVTIKALLKSSKEDCSKVAFVQSFIRKLAQRSYSTF